jgi:cohesin loading factor subunit SCC2
LSGSNASTLLPYLKTGTSVCFHSLSLSLYSISLKVEEQATTDYLLKIFRASIPHMPKTAIKFGQELQAALKPMVLKPTNNIQVRI